MLRRLPRLSLTLILDGAYHLDMARRFLRLGTALCIAVLAVFAVALPDARLGLIALALAIGGVAWWLTARLPVRVASASELRGGALLALAGGIAAALLVPSTRVACDCPPPAAGALAGFVCNCPVERYMVLRLAIGGLAATASLALAWTARSRSRSG